jgi:hypothetical protein
MRFSRSVRKAVVQELWPVVLGIKGVTVEVQAQVIRPEVECDLMWLATCESLNNRMVMSRAESSNVIVPNTRARPDAVREVTGP